MSTLGAVAVGMLVGVLILLAGMGWAWWWARGRPTRVIELTAEDWVRYSLHKRRTREPRR